MLSFVTTAAQLVPYTALAVTHGTTVAAMLSLRVRSSWEGRLSAWYTTMRHRLALRILTKDVICSKRLWSCSKAAIGLRELARGNHVPNLFHEIIAIDLGFIGIFAFSPAKYEIVPQVVREDLANFWE